MSWTFRLEQYPTAQAFQEACEKLNKLAGQEGSLIRNLGQGKIVVLSQPKDSQPPQNTSINTLRDFTLQLLQKNKDYLNNPAARTLMEQKWKLQPSLYQGLIEFCAKNPLNPPSQPKAGESAQKFQEDVTLTVTVVGASKSQSAINRRVQNVIKNWPEGAEYFAKNKGEIVKALIALYKKPQENTSVLNKFFDMLSPATEENKAKFRDFLAFTLTEAKKADFAAISEQDKQELFTLLDLMSVKDVPGALNFKGFCYEYDIGVEGDIEGAAFSYEDAAMRLNDPAAQYNLGMIILKNIVPSFSVLTEAQRIKEALIWIKLAAENGNQAALQKMGTAYLYGVHALGIQPDRSAALKVIVKAADLGYFDLAVKQGHAESQFRLALSKLQDKKNPKASTSEAVTLLTHAAKQGHLKAKVELEKLLGPQEKSLQQAENIIDAVTALYDDSFKDPLTYPELASTVLSHFIAFDLIEASNFNEALKAKTLKCANAVNEAIKKKLPNAHLAQAELAWHGLNSKTFERDYHSAQYHFSLTDLENEHIAKRFRDCIVEFKSVNPSPPG